MTRAAVLAVCLLGFASSGCVVLGLDRFHDELSITFDERLLGAWRNAEDDVDVTVERSDWRAYRIRYEQATERGTLTAYLFTIGGQTFLDVTPTRGQDLGTFVLPMHVAMRVTIEPDQVTVSPLSYDWFDSGLRRGTLPATLGASRGERDQVVLTAGRTVLETWLAERPKEDPAFAPGSVFKRQHGPFD